MSLPSSGGIVLSQSLNILENFNLTSYDHNSLEYNRLLIEAMRFSFADRSKFLGDSDFNNFDISRITSKKYAKSLSKIIKNSSRKIIIDTPGEYLAESEETTHFSIIDSLGNAVSNTYTLGLSFGSGVTIPGTGILMNSQMNNFAYRYGDKNDIGRGASPGNRFEPGKKPMSTMAPTIVFDKNDDLFLITGSPGGSDIPAAILRVITGVIDFNLDIGEATMLPRIHKDWPYEGLEHERAVSRDIVRRLKSMGHKTEYENTIGSTQSIHISEGVNYGFADLRRPNAGVSVQAN